MPTDYSIGLLATGRGEGSRGLLRAIHEAVSRGHIPGRISFVFCNRDPGEFVATDGFLDMVRGYGYPLITHSSRKFRSAAVEPSWRLPYEQQVMDMLAQYQADIILLAGFLLIVPEMCNHYPMINLHPAAPNGPTGMWNEVIWDLIEARATTTGNTIFRVTSKLDAGPIATYCTFSTRGADFDAHWAAVRDMPMVQLRTQYGEDLPLFQAIRREGVIRERPLVIETLKSFAEGQLNIENGHIVNGLGKPIPGQDLSDRIEAIIAQDTTIE